MELKLGTVKADSKALGLDYDFCRGVWHFLEGSLDWWILPKKCLVKSGFAISSCMLNTKSATKHYV